METYGQWKLTYLFRTGLTLITVMPLNHNHDFKARHACEWIDQFKTFLAQTHQDLRAWENLTISSQVKKYL